MSVINATPLLAAAGGDYQISRSVRLRSSASAYFNRTPSSSGTRTKTTISLWVKRGSLGARTPLVVVRQGATDYFILEFQSDDTLQAISTTSSSVNTQLVTSAVYRDPSAWYHIVFTYDSTVATPNSSSIYLTVNGVKVTTLSTATYPSQNTNIYYNVGSVEHDIGKLGNLATYADGYLTEINSIDGQALSSTSFGQFNSVTGVWQPLKYTGTYGTNGFYLNFSDNSAATAAAIGKDSSGNGNNWTPNNISLTAGATYDSMIDTPTPYADGGNGRGNYPVLNPLNKIYGNPSTSNGNLSGTASSADAFLQASMFCPLSGSWYAECTVTSKSGALQVEMRDASANTNYAYNSDTGAITGTTAGATYTTNDVIGVAFDYASQTIKFYKNNVLQGTSPSITQTLQLTFSNYIPNSSTSVAWNFGQRPFSYTPPTGFKALNTQNLPDATITKGNQYFDATLYTGNGSSLSVTNSGSMQPDFVWLKGRSVGYDHFLYDSVRGSLKNLSSNLTAAEQTVSNSLTSFNSNGFSLGGGTSSINASGTTYVGWQWKAGGTAVSNTAGSITSQVSANVSAGFSVVTWSGTGAAGTVGHGLGVAPSMIIARDRNAVSNWSVYHVKANATPQNGRLQLNTTDAFAAGSGFWNNTAPNSSVFTAGSGLSTSGYNQIAYCFSEVAGYSKFGSYTGNGSADGPFVYCGFRPRFIMVKRTDVSNFWLMMDTTRNTYNVMGDGLLANTSGAEFGWNPSKDILSNGFKVRTSDAAENASGGTYIFMALAESPFKNSLAR